MRAKNGFTKGIYRLGVGFIAAAFISAPLYAQSKPKGAKPADPNVVIQLFAGKTSTWTNGFAYWQPDGTSRTLWLNRKPEIGGKYSVGFGTWTVSTKGKRCFTSTFYYSDQTNDGKTNTFEGKKRCAEFVVDKDGVLWSRETKPDRGKWYQFSGKKESKGELKRAKFRSVAKKLGAPT